MKLNQGDVIECTDGTFCLITFPTNGEDYDTNDGCWCIDAAPCDADGNREEGYEVGQPTRTADFETNHGPK